MKEIPKINGSIDSIMDSILGADPSKLSSEFVLKTIFGPDYQVPEDTEDDPELELKMESELFEKSINDMVESLSPRTLSIPIQKIEDLSCEFEGDILYAWVLKTIYESKNPGRKIMYFNGSSQVEKIISDDSPQLLSDIKEELFDNISPSVFDKPFNFSNKKNRTISILGIPISFDIIMSGNKPIHFSLKSDINTSSDASNRLKSILDERKSKRKPCENEADDFDIESNYPDSTRDFTVDEPPLVDDLDCDPPYTQNPLTGEPLFNIQDLERIKEETCVEPEDLPTPEREFGYSEPEQIDPAEQIDRCLNIIDAKQKELINNVDLLSRFIKLEQQVEEIYTHYRIISEYYESLYLEFENLKKGLPLTGFSLNSPDEFIKELELFSIRFKGTKLNTNGSINFTFSYPTLRQENVPYEEVDSPQIPNLSGGITQGTSKVIKVDNKKIRIGQEYKQDGVLYERSQNFFDSVGTSLNFIHTGSSGIPEIADFYDFIGDIQGSTKEKSEIISQIQDKRGFLYGQLIESSASPWLFFTPEERGDNDARDPSKLRASSYNQEGEPNQKFLDFWGNYKDKWDQKYNDVYDQSIKPKIESILSLGRSAAAYGASFIGLNPTQPTDITNFNPSEYIAKAKNELSQRKTELEDLIVFIGTKISEFKDNTSPDRLKNDFNVSCLSGDSANPFPRKSPDCPPPCCGPAGSDFMQDNYLQSTSDSSDCPTIYQICWWKEFSKKATILGLLPYPNGLPPVEDSNFFLTPGPSVRFGFRYWPVGYAPPSFIPIAPAVNPIDGLPYIRIPLPMIWTIIDPIVIPLPLGLGTIVIFIPFIGGFMPTPLVYLRENLFGTSLFLSGIRGPRFIPRKSDPKLKDPLRSIKEKLTHGIPDKLIPLPGFGKEVLDSPDSILKEVNSNINKILDRIEPLKNTPDLDEAQNIEREMKRKIDENKREYKKRSALYEDSKPEESLSQDNIDSIIRARKNALKKTIGEFFDKKMTTPRDIRFPKDKDKLKFGLPSELNFKSNIKDVSRDLSPIDAPKYVNLREEMKYVLKSMKVDLNPLLSPINKNLTNRNSILIFYPGDPLLISGDELASLISSVKAQMSISLHRMMKGDKKSINERIRNGAFSLIYSANSNGAFNFPEFKMIDGAPAPLKLNKLNDPYLDGMYLRLMSGISSLNLNRNDFVEFTREISSDLKSSISSISSIANVDLSTRSSAVIIRVKDFKRLLATKIGMGKPIKNDPISVENAIKNPTPANIVNAVSTRINSGGIIDAEEPLISKYPYPQGLSGSYEKTSTSFGKAFSPFEFSQSFPFKQDQISQTPLAGGIPQIVISGSIIKDFLSESLKKFIDNDIDLIMPEINDVDSPKFMNLNSQDIVKMTRRILDTATDPNGVIPPFLSPTQIPVFPQSRPTGIAEMAIMSLGAPPQARIPLSLLWKTWMGSSKVPISNKILNPLIKTASGVLSSIPWPIIPLLGRNVLNIISPIALSDDLPDWKRLSLKNAYFVVYLDEFLRSAADVSGLFKFCFGAADPLYPIPELPSELQKAFNNITNSKKY